MVEGGGGGGEDAILKQLYLYGYVILICSGRVMLIVVQ